MTPAVNTDAFNAYADELGILGAIISGESAAAQDAIDALIPGWVGDEEIRESIDLARGIIESGEACDAVAMTKAWPNAHGSLPMPLELWGKAADQCHSPANWTRWLEGIKEAATRRWLRDQGQQAAKDAANPAKPIEQTLSKLDWCTGNPVESRAGIVSSADVMNAFVSALEDRRKRKGQLSGVPTGFRKLDDLTDGLQFGEMAVIAARPSIGKTAIGCNVSRVAAIEQNIPTLFVTAEMSNVALMRRIFCDVANISLGSLKTGSLSEAEEKRGIIAGSRISKAPLFFHCGIGNESVGSVVAAIRAAKRKHGIRLVVVDYLQKLRAQGRHEKRTYEVGEVSGALKSCVVSTGVAMLTLAQLNRESENDKDRPPRLADLADSGQIERDADLVGLLARTREKGSGPATLTVAKQRDGETGVVRLTFDGAHQRFTDPAPDIRPEDCLP